MMRKAVTNTRHGRSYLIFVGICHQDFTRLVPVTTMLAFLLALAGAIAPSNAFEIPSINSLLSPTKPPTEDFDGLEFRYRRLIFRPALFQTEAYIFAAFGLYVLYYFYGKSVNMKRATAWLVLSLYN